MVVRVCEVDVNLDRLEPGTIPSLHQCVIADVDILALHLDGATIWMRRDQANELAAKLMVHLPSAGVVTNVFDKPYMVHNHGYDPNCREQIVDGRLRGACMTDGEAA